MLRICSSNRRVIFYQYAIVEFCAWLKIACFPIIPCGSAMMSWRKLSRGGSPDNFHRDIIVGPHGTSWTNWWIDSTYIECMYEFDFYCFYGTVDFRIKQVRFKQIFYLSMIWLFTKWKFVVKLDIKSTCTLFQFLMYASFLWYIFSRLTEVVTMFSLEQETRGDCPYLARVLWF